MSQSLKSVYLLIVFTGLFIVAISAEVSAQEVSATLKADVLKIFAESTMEIDVDGVKIRGHEIGNGKFKTCEGKSIDINNRPLRKSDRCPQPSGTHNVRAVSGEIVDLDAKTSTVELKDDAGTITKVFLPSSVRLVTDGELDQSSTMSFNMKDAKGRRLTIYFVISGRAEALTVGY